VNVCFFDIDGTLVLTGGAGMHAFAETFAEEFGVPELCRDIPFAGQSDRGIAAGLFRAHGIEDTPDTWDRFRAGYVRRLGHHVRTRGGGVLPGVFSLIDQLQQRGDVLIGLLTGNVAAAAQIKLDHYGLWDRFAFGGFGDHHPDRNDIAAEALAQARSRHPGDLGEARLMVIGDTLNDIRCARSIGAYAVAVPTGHTSAETLATGRPDLLAPTLECAEALLRFFDR
jgi:phosphoglycolate phosphatase-like HAD superfamily hydrolase